MKWINFALLVGLFSCHAKVRTTNLPSLRDTVVRDCLQEMDSLQELDTTEIGYKLLDSYIRNDTSTLIRFQKYAKAGRQIQRQFEVMDSCIHQLRLQDLPADEAYRFNYRRAFCPYKLDVTLSKRDSSVNLHFIIYQYEWRVAVGDIVNEYDKKLTIKDWNDFKKAIEYADFWALKMRNEKEGFDGDDIIVSGFIKRDTAFRRPARFHRVVRWLVNSTSLEAPFDLALKLSGNRQGCYLVK
jgi:hypothetical protein